MIRVVVEQDGQRQALNEGELPLVIGGSARSLIRVADAESTEELAYIARSNGALFVQPAVAGGLRYNSHDLQSSQWLADGDTLEGDSFRLVCEVKGDEVSLRVGPPERDTGSAQHTLPPVVLEPPESPARTVLEPTAFKPSAAGASQRNVRGPLLTAMLLLVLLFAAGGWFTFSARSVLVVVTPFPEHLVLSGGYPVLPLGGRYLALPGRYEVAANLAGYHDLRASIDVGAAASQRFEFQLARLPGRISISSGALSGALVSIDGEPVGTTPLTALTVEPGTHQLDLRLDRYQDWRGELTVEGGGTQQSLDVELVPGWGTVFVKSLPSGAQVSVDDALRGETPIALDLMAGTYRLEVSRELWKTWSAQLDVQATATLTLPEVLLEKADASLSVRSRPAGAVVSVDGEYRGKTPLSVSIPADQSVTVTVARAGHDSVSRDLTLGPAQSSELSLRLPVRMGEVRVEVNPQDAEVVVDGVSRGMGSRTLELAAVPHTIEVRREGYEPHKGKVSPRVGYAQVVSVELEPVGGIAPGGPPPEKINTAEGQLLRLVEPGRLTMGASRREQGRRANETLRKVELTRAYYLAVREVSNAEFRRFAPGHRSGMSGRQTLDGDEQPVVRVSWDQAARYCNWLSEKDGLAAAYAEKDGRMQAVVPPNTGYRMPSEAEWAWAARAAGRPSPVKYPWGAAWPPARGSGNFGDVSARTLLGNTIADYDDGYAVTAPGERFAVNPLGIYDLGGNVAEWCHDRYTIYSSGGPRVKDPLGPTTGRYYVIRGSSWRDASITELRLSYRDYGDKPRPDVGFRIARYVQ